MDNLLEKLSWFGRKKPFDSLDVDYNRQSPLPRKLSTFHLLFLCLGETLGFGIFLVNGYVSKEVAGPGAVLSFILAGVIALIPAACFAEFASKLPRMGSSYDYIYVTIGEFVAFLVGWNLLLEFTLRAIAMAQMCSHTIDRLTDNQVQNLTLTAFQSGTPWKYNYIVDYPNILGSLCIAVGIVVVFFGAKFTAKVVSVLLILKFAVVAFTIYLGIVTAGDTSFNTHSHGILPYGAVGVIRGILPCYFAFTAFNTLGTAAGETRTPNKSIPRSMVWYMMVSIITYLLNAVSLNLAVDATYIKPGEAYFETFSLTGHKSLVWGRYFIGLGSVCTVFSSTVVSLFCIPRILLAICNDGLLFPCVDEETIVEKRLSLKPTLLFAAAVVLVTMFIKVHAFEQFQSAGVLCSLALVSVGLVILRYTPYRQLKMTDGDAKQDCEGELSGLFRSETQDQESHIPEVGEASNHGGYISNQTTDEDESTPEENSPLFSANEPKETVQLDRILESELSRLLPDRNDENDDSIFRERQDDDKNAICSIPGTLKRDLHPVFERLGQFAPGAVVVSSLLATIAFQVGFVAVVTYTGFLVSSKSKAWSVMQAILLALSLICPLPIYLHYQRDRQKGITEVPFVPTLPLISIFIDILFLFQIPATTWLRSLMWLVVGLVIYFTYGFSHSRQNYNRHRKRDVRYNISYHQQMPSKPGQYRKVETFQQVFDKRSDLLN